MIPFNGQHRWLSTMEPSAYPSLRAALKAVITTNTIPSTSDHSTLSDYLETLPPKLDRLDAELAVQRRPPKSSRRREQR